MRICVVCVSALSRHYCLFSVATRFSTPWCHLKFKPYKSSLFKNRAKKWRYTSRKGWKPMRRKRLPLLSKNQRKARLLFARKYRKFTADSSETLSLAMSALNIFSIFPTLKATSYWAQRRVKFRHRTKLMKAPNAWFVANRPRPHSVTFYPARTYCNGRVFHYKNPWERSEASLI